MTRKAEAVRLFVLVLVLAVLVGCESAVLWECQTNVCNEN
jgi:hypothetical protein